MQQIALVLQMPQHAKSRMHLLVVPAFSINTVNTKYLQFAASNLRRKDRSHSSILIIEEPSSGRREDQQRRALVAENQQFHFAIEFAAVPFVVLAVHGSGCILHRAAGIEAVDSTMHTLTEDDVRQRLDPERLIAALEVAFRDRYPSTEIPLRKHINLGVGMFLIMPCYDRSSSALGMKLVTVQENPARPQDRIQATYMLFDPKTASPKLIIPANYLTDVRTAGTSAL